MYTEQTFQVQREWSEEALLLLRKLLPLMAPVATAACWTEEERETLGHLLSASARSSESALLLCIYGQLWDCEILVRSVLEGTLKYVYILQSQSKSKERFLEYSRELWEIGLLKDHEKASTLLEALQHPNSIDWKPIYDMLLSSEELTLFRDRYPKPRRRELDRKWGFTGIINELTNSKDPILSSFKALAHGYSIASHVAHADCAGTSIALERDMRSSARREAIHLAHLSRLISDIFTYFEMRLFIGYRFINHSIAPIGEAAKAIEELMARKKEIYESWISKEYTR